jgi:hypothetical protein
LEELLPKDNENILPFPDGPVVPSEPQSFLAEQMVRCEECLRANPPTRVSCIYCAATLPATERTANLQKPTLRPLEKWELGYNCILKGKFPRSLSEETLAEVTSLLKLGPDDLKRIMASAPLPLARTATPDDASLVNRRLQALGVETITVSDKDLDVEQQPIRVRAAESDEAGITVYPLGGGSPNCISWSNLFLLVSGRLTSKRVEVKERKGRRRENEILDMSEFFSDELVADIYREGELTNFRIVGSSFDFSCLGHGKSLISRENLAALIQVMREKAPQAAYDNSYDSVRPALEPVWPSEQQVESRGWRRERPGKYTTGESVETTNEGQFLRYSRLRYYLRTTLG